MNLNRSLLWNRHRVYSAGLRRTPKISHYVWIGVFTFDGIILTLFILSLMFYSVQKLIINAIYSVFQLLGI